MKIAIVVQGRFHSFDLARALIARGHDVTVFTNYPRWAVLPFGIEESYVRSFWCHGVMARIDSWLNGKIPRPDLEPALHMAFGRWAAREIRREHWDVVHCWSGVAEEELTPVGADHMRLLMRGSAHIATQSRLLEEEELRTGARLDRPSAWMIEREQREYEATDKIVVLSTFARESFIAAGVRPDKLLKLPLAARADQFRADHAAVAARRERILAGRPLRVLYVGALSFRKGLWDCANIVRELGGRGFEFRFVGPIAPEVEPLLPTLAGKAKIIPKQAQARLAEFYSWGDV